MHCLCPFIVPIARLPPFVRFVGVTNAPLGREKGSLTALCSILVLEQQRPSASLHYKDNSFEIGVDFEVRSTAWAALLISFIYLRCLGTKSLDFRG